MLPFVFFCFASKIEMAFNRIDRVIFSHFGVNCLDNHRILLRHPVRLRARNHSLALDQLCLVNSLYAVLMESCAPERGRQIFQTDYFFVDE